jgi:hypothetical protein
VRFKNCSKFHFSEFFNASLFLTEEQRRTVEVLNLSGNNFSTPEKLYLDGFENLRVLNLSNNGLHLFDPEIVPEPWWYKNSIPTRQ